MFLSNDSYILEKGAELRGGACLLRPIKSNRSQNFFIFRSVSIYSLATLPVSMPPKRWKKTNGGGVSKPKKFSQSPRGSKTNGWQNKDKWEPPRWTSDTGMDYEEWLVDMNPNGDPAERLLYNKYMTVLPPQCWNCIQHGRRVRYLKGKDITRLQIDLCQDCRNNGIRLTNLEYALFTAKRKEDQKQKVAQISHDEEEEEEEEEDNNE